MYLFTSDRCLQKHFIFLISFITSETEIEIFSFYFFYIFNIGVCKTILFYCFLSFTTFRRAWLYWYLISLVLSYRIDIKTIPTFLNLIYLRQIVTGKPPTITSKNTYKNQKQHSTSLLDLRITSTVVQNQTTT